MSKLKIWLLLVTLIFGMALGVQGKKVHTLGDSTMAPYDENTTNTRGWGMYFGNFLTNGWTSVNYAKGGRDSRAGYNELWQNAKNNVEAGDFVLIQFAHNDTQYSGMDNLQLQEYYNSIGDATSAAAVKKDGRGTIPASTYKECLKQICDAVKEKGATPILVSAVCRCYFTNGVAPITRPGRHDIGGKFSVLTSEGIKANQSVAESDHTWDYSYQMEQLANELGVTFIDMTSATKDLYESYGTYDKCYAALFDKGGEKDNTHYNLTGALTAARLCAQLMKEKGILTDAIEIPSDLSCNPSVADMGEVYVGQSATKELTLSGLGLDPATGTVTITATDGILLSTDKQNWQTSLEASYENGTLIKTFYAKVAISAAGTFNGTITAATSGKSIQIPVTVNGIELGGGDPFTATWSLNNTDKTKAAVEGNATAADVKYEGLETYGYVNGYGALIAPTGSTGAWPTAAIDDQNQYVQFTVTAPEGRKLDISKIGMKIKARGGGSLQCHVYYSTDGFVTRKTIFSTSAALTGTWNEINADAVAQVEEGEQLLIRVYPWSGNVDNGRWICISDVVVSGQSKDAAGVNIPGTITYALDKGGLNQGDDAVLNPNELNAGFAGKKWSAGSALTVDGINTYQGASGEANIKQTKVANNSGASLSGTAGADNTLTLTLTPEDGFSFVPSKVSFEAARYGTDGGNISASVEAGTTTQVLVDNKGVNRSGKSLTVAKFSEAVNGVTATADNPLKVNFSFLSLGNGKSMGISNVVIEGTLVGAAAQVTKYGLTTQVSPVEGGSISRDPDMERYKEGTNVTLKATKNFGYKFKEWQDENGSVVSTDAETTVTMDAEKTMKAIFEQIPVYTITTKVTNEDERNLGSITLTPNDHNNQYEQGAIITATANENKIIKFLSWTDENENATAGTERQLTVNGDMTLVANYEVQDFIAVFDASKTQSYAYDNTAGYPFSADETWDNQRNAKSSVVKVSDGSLCYTQSTGTPVVRNRQGVVISDINGLYQNGYHTADIAWQYQFSTKGFTSAKFVADMCAKNAATRQYKALISIDGGEFTELKSAWDVTANVANPLSIDLPAEAVGKELVIIRITGTGEETYNTTYPFNKTFDDMRYSDHSESGVGNVFVLGEAEVVADEVAPKVTATIPADNATGVSANGRITISFDERIQAVEGAASATLNGTAIEPTWNSRSVSFDYKGLDYNTAYTFTMPANFVQDRSGNKYAEAVVINFTTMNRPSVTKALYDFIVPDDGTIDEALAAANSRADKATRFRVFVKNSDAPYVFHPAGKVTGGDGKEYDNPTSILTAANTSFIGESIEGVILTNVTPAATWDNGFGAACPLEGIGKGDVLQIKGANSYFQNLTIKTSMGDHHGRDIAVNDQSNRTIFKDACLWGYQDTYVSNNNNSKFYFEGGIIRGCTDYMCGKGDVYYNKVTLRQVKGGYSAVPSLPKKYGYIYQSCKIVGDTNDVDGNFTLGRPWGKGTPIALFIDTEMEVVPSQIGWSEMSGGYPKRFAEYGSHTSNGAPVSTEGRKTVYDAYDSRTEKIVDGQKVYEYVNRRDEYNNPILTAEEAAVPTLAAVMGQDDDWQPTLLTEQAPVPTNVAVNGAVVTWDASDYALLWAVCLDGNVVAFTTEPTYTATKNGSYAVRAANEMGGLSAISQAVVVSEASGINVINTQSQEVSSVEIYTIDGKRLSNLQSGLNIVRQKMSDGSMKTIKVFK
jgi:lysophospholipase L1-like esterase